MAETVLGPTTQEACKIMHNAICSHPKKDEEGRRHKCLGEMTITRDLVIIDCPLCGYADQKLTHAAL